MKDNLGIKRNGKRLIAVLCMIITLGTYSIVVEPSMTVQAATTTQRQEFQAELKKMILTGDTSVHNISKYNLKYSEANSVWNELINGDCLIAYKSSINIYMSTTSSNYVLQTISIKNIDSGYVDRYNKMNATINSIRSGIDANMTDVDKVLYFHDYLVNNTTYANNGNVSFIASGPLAFGYGVCSGYAEALRTLLSLEGIENSRVFSSAMNHTWLYAKLDGNWYHIDPTWNDTGSALTSGKTRTFLLKNDNEFTTDAVSKHYNWYVSSTQETATSTLYSNWFVHDVVGKMLYYKGLWYYVNQNTNELLASDINGNNLQKIVIGDKTSIVIDNITNGNIYYTYNGKQETIDLNVEGFKTVDFTKVVETKPLLTSAVSTLENNTVDGINWNNLENWRTGNYSYTNGLYAIDSTRICLKDYLPCESGATYSVVSSNSQYQVLIREMTKDMKFIKSSNLKDGQTFTTTDSTMYLAVSLYNATTTAKDYTAYQTLFNGGYQLDIITVGAPAAATPAIEAPKTVVLTSAVEEKAVLSEVSSGSTNKTVDGYNWNGFENWRTGNYYYTNGIYTKEPTRICLNEYLTCDSNVTYAVKSSNIQYQVLIREMNKDQQFIKSHNLKDGQSFTTTENTAYLAVSLYNAINAAKDYTTYQTLFNGGYQMSIARVLAPAAADPIVVVPAVETLTVVVPVAEAPAIQAPVVQEPTVQAQVVEVPVASTPATVEPVQVIDEVLTTNYSDFSNWRSGNYYYTTGIYQFVNNRICLNNYLKCSNNKNYQVTSSQSGYNVLVREMSSDMTFITSHNLTNGASFTTSNNTAFLAISIYNVNESNMTLSYDQYRLMFESGFVVTIK